MSFNSGNLFLLVRLFFGAAVELNDMHSFLLGIICIILYTSWKQNGVWLSKGSSAFCSIQKYIERKEK
jgi:hypothetical protein